MNRILTRPASAAVLLMAVYAALAGFNSTDGYLGADTGAKVITLDRMVTADTMRLDVGYWAEEWDPDGRYHPLLDTFQNDKGEWVNVTTVPMLLGARPLYALGGYRLALALPMLGAVLAAFACRSIARTLASEEAGWWTYWVIAVGSPLAIYALDLWEHSLGAALMLWGVALLLRVLFADGSIALALGSGLLFGASSTMRTETFVVAFVAVLASVLLLMVQRRASRGLAAGALALAGFIVPWFGNAILEAELGGNSRATRVSGQVQSDSVGELRERAEEALITWFGAPNLGFPDGALVGFVAVCALAMAVALFRGRRMGAAAVALAVLSAIYLLSFSEGLGFVPGALVASPFAVASAFTRRDRRKTFVMWMAGAMTLLIWAFQYTGGAMPQWGGRYLIVPTLLLSTLGVVALSGFRSAVPRYAVTGVAVMVTAFGVAWLNVRSHGVDDFFDELARQPESVIISDNGFLIREAGPAASEHRYLSVGRGGDVEGAVAVVENAGLQTFGVLTQAAEADRVLGAQVMESRRIEFLDFPLWYHSYRLER